jgi:D-alanyl-D-alanine carboxypeptidase (penicillin-binding protein 5/6)
MAILSSALIRELPEIYAMYSQKEFTYNDIKQFNRNSLLWDQSLNVDGIKTGHTSDAGYSLITSATQDDMRLISVVMGTESVRARKAENKKLLRYGFRFYESVNPYQAGESFVAHRIFMGDKDTVELGINVDTPITIPRGQASKLTAHFELSEQLSAPIEKDKEVGILVLKLEEDVIASYPLVTLEAVNEGGLIDKAKDWISLQLGLEE